MRMKRFLQAACFLLLPVLLPALHSHAAVGDQMIDTSLLHAMVMENAYRMEAGRKIKFMIVDARTLQEYSEAHVMGAVSVPEKDFERSQKLLPQDKSTLMVVYCNDKKCVKSRRWAAKAAAAGYTNIVVYADGFPHWRERHMPIAY